MRSLTALLFLTIISTAFNPAKAQQRGLNFAVTTVIRDYLEIKNSLLVNNAGLAQNKAGKMVWDLNNVPTKDMSSPQHSAWFDYLARLQRSSREISESNSISYQRKHFSALSNTLYGALKDMKMNPFTMYKLYSASNDSYWLSDHSVVKNPYYGAADKKKSKDGIVKEILPTDPINK
jgi:hypothetical protein